MKIKEITIQNVKSFKDKQTVKFKDGLNMFIGSNASGKSNLMEIINTVLKYYFIYSWRFKTVTEQELSYSYVVIDSIEDGRKHLEPIEKFLDKNLASQDQEQKIKITVMVTRSDIESMKTVKQNFSSLRKFEKDELRSSHLQKLDLGGEEMEFEEFTDKEFEFEIVNNKPVAKNDHENADIFLNYLNYHELLRYLVTRINDISSDKYDVKTLAPAYQHLSSKRTSGGKQKSESQLSKNTSIFKNLEKEPVVFSVGMKEELANSKEMKNIIQESEYEEILKSVVKKLGYDSIKLYKSEEEKGYELSLKKSSSQGGFTKASSGELQILDFLFSTIIGRMHGGLIMIGEPELHLYPQRQRIMLDLINELSGLFDLQFIISTHSPWMINSSTIEDTFRVYKEDETSKIYSPSRRMLQETNARDLVLIVNALNNEKMFFSEKVILVEGVADRIIFETIMRILQEEAGNYEAIEIIDVYGKGNLKRFKNFLAEWNIKSYIIADNDYLNDLMRERNKRTDRKSFNNRLREEGIFILPEGELEDYFHQGHFDIDKAIDITQQIITGNRKIPDEFKLIISEIINK